MHVVRPGMVYLELAADAGVDTSVSHETLFLSEIEEGAMGDARLLCRSAWVCRPCVQMRVEVDDGDGAIYLVERPEDGKHNSVVTTKSINDVGRPSAKRRVEILT